ncbi:M56 family metallopeptidase [Runella sp.]|uniref:M56 family metallopeptidase n=1 Tax=Runella sp. TaxID=1960881 RepID=UPI003D0B2A23
MNYEFLSYLLKAGLVLAILTAAYAWLVKRETFLQVNRWLLWINVAATLFLPIIPLPDFAWMPDAPAKAVAVVLPTKESTYAPILPEKEHSLPSSQPTTASNVNSNNAQESSPLSLWEWAAILYIAVAGLLTLKLLIQLGALWHLKRNGIPHETDEGVYLIESKKITSPFSFFHWVFYNPAHHNDEEWAQVWAHECVHAHQRHSIDMLTAEALKIVFWFNPFAWWHQRLVQETLEFITDRAVLDSGIEKKSYQYHLLRTTLSTDNQAFVNHFNKSQLKIRIEMMNRKKSKWLGLSKYVVFVGMLWVCAAFTKPYQVKAAAQVVEKLQKWEVVKPPKASEKPVFNDFVLEKPSKNMQKETGQFPIPAVVADTQQYTSATKYIIYEGNMLNWLVTPKMTLEDLVEMKKEFTKRNLIFDVTEVKMDPLNQFIIGIAARGSRNEHSGCGFAHSDTDKFEPLASWGDIFRLAKEGLVEPARKTICRPP